ncbi:MAG: Nif3-like dinuclear metal center hexameric protein [Bacteriovoracaceae bacterium]|jgi:dinuclear metal center YbgI/SA1388 family protein|nr:Nif3-like dinuclear metal center hexameric protein [Bacteriovoracaceae bacterium]
MKRNELESYLAEYLSTGDFKDYCPNGLQIEGHEEIKKLAFAVTATQASIDFAASNKCSGLVVHHGLLWNFEGGKPLRGHFGNRMKSVIGANLNLLAYHLPLDSHLEIGNAASLASRIGLTDLSGFGDYKGMPTGVQGRFSKPIKSCELKTKLLGTLNNEVRLASRDHNLEIETMAIITGGANHEWRQALELGLDAYLTGEMQIQDWHEVMETDFQMFSGGHHATERFGIQALMAHIESKFKTQCLFFDECNPL